MKQVIYVYNVSKNMYLEQETVSFAKAKSRLMFWASIGRKAYSVPESLNP